MTYHLYGRTQHTDPLHFIREITADDQQELQKLLDAARNEEEWVELISFPEQAIVPVIEEGEPV